MSLWRGGTLNQTQKLSFLTWEDLGIPQSKLQSVAGEKDLRIRHQDQWSLRPHLGNMEQNEQDGQRGDILALLLRTLSEKKILRGKVLKISTLFQHQLTQKLS